MKQKYMKKKIFLTCSILSFLISHSSQTDYKKISEKNNISPNILLEEENRKGKSVISAIKNMIYNLCGKVTSNFHKETDDNSMYSSIAENSTYKNQETIFTNKDLISRLSLVATVEKITNSTIVKKTGSLIQKSQIKISETISKTDTDYRELKD
jgi:hypothetical protein